MAFSSTFFLFAFLPSVMIAYTLLPFRFRNGFLLASSLLFYAFDTGWLCWILLASIAGNHFAARALTATAGRLRTAIFITGLVLNLLPLLYYKYAEFLFGAAAALLPQFTVRLGHIELPIGISFFTFQAISYIVDVYAGRVIPARRLVDFGAYHSLFPQLIAGPIVRYIEVESSIRLRPLSWDATADGAFRFCLGLGKKLIIADTLGAVADQAFGLPTNELTASIAWFALVCYTLQIYYDFSGYSDMAIGLGLMLGFRFPENFNQPYLARSITEFWRRWHMTLSRWFRDYVYIPLGGSHAGTWRTYRNLFTVFLLCGLWHGAGNTFLAWGLYHGALLTTERIYQRFVGPLPTGPFAWITTAVLVMVGWVLFRSPDLGSAGHYLMTMFALRDADVVYYGLASFATPRTVAVMAIGIFFAIAPISDYAESVGRSALAVTVKGVPALAILVYSVLILSANSFNPFIYFRF